MTTYEIAIGIDTGKNTGFAIWNKTSKKLEEVTTTSIHKALFRIKEMHEKGYKMKVYVEDARKATFGRSNDIFKAQGAGSVKRDAVIFEDFLKEYGIPHEMKRPVKGKTKWDKNVFAKVTGYTGTTSTHGRDAACLIYGM